MNLLKLTFRILRRNKLFTLINLTELLLGFTVFIAIGIVVLHQSKKISTVNPAHILRSE